MNELRQDSISREWVVFAPGRHGRPRDFPDHGKSRRMYPEYDSECPFCPGNETLLPEITHETRSPTGSAYLWSTRAVVNRFPAFSLQDSEERKICALNRSMSAHGRHEVIIETPIHNPDIHQMTRQQVVNILATCRHRYRELIAMPGTAMVTIFRNHGVRAGTSLIHPHSQIVAAPVVSSFIRNREEQALRHFDDTGRCIYCVVLAQELKNRERLIATSQHFTAFIPYAAPRPFETWIVPRRHSADFGTMTDVETVELAHVLRDILGRMAHALDTPDYNYVIHSGTRYRTEEPHLHWYVQISPRLLTRAGFEIGSGFRINPSVPEHNALTLGYRELQV